MKNWFNDKKSFLTNDYVQSRRNRVDHSYSGITHTVCGAYCWCKTTECVPLQPHVWHLNSWRRVLLPAGMMPIWSGQGCKVTAGSFSQQPASCCVRPISPWSISLNIPSPPTHTTLLENKTRESFITGKHLPLSSPVLVQCWQALPIEACQVFLQEVISGLVRPLSH